MYPVALFTYVSIKMQGQANCGTEMFVIPLNITPFSPEQVPIT
jgi:hypothetical protein